MSVHLDCNTWFVCDLEKARRLDYVRQHPWSSFRDLHFIFSNGLNNWEPEKCGKVLLKLNPCEACKRQANVGF